MYYIKKKKILFRLFLLFLLFLLYIFTSAFFYTKKISNSLESNIFRLHIIANSNNKEDQEVKYIVRNNIIDYMNKLCIDTKNKNEVITTVSDNLENFEKIANQTLKENNYPYTATVELGNFEFPSKKYSNVTFPAGFYDALKIKLGQSAGQNWWCVLYPSLCFIDNTATIPKESDEILKENLSDEEYFIISNSGNPIYNLKFKIVELFSNSKFKFPQNI